MHQGKILEYNMYFVKCPPWLCFSRLLHTKYESFGSCGFGEEDFLCVSHDAPPGVARMDPRGTVGRIYKEDHYILLLTKYESSGPCGFGEEDFFMFYP